MATVGEIFRWISIHLGLLQSAVVRRYRRLIARILRSDPVVAGSERKFRSLLEAAPDAVVIVDWHGHVKLINAQAERLFGASRKEIFGQNLTDLMPARMRGPHREHFKRFLADPQPRPMGSGADLYALRKDGVEVPVEISLGPLATDEGLLVFAAIRDISARKQAEAALREVEERFRTAFDEAPVGMALASLDGRLQQVNRALCEMTGYARAELEATTLEAIIHPDDVDADRDARERLAGGDGTRYRAERRYVHASGQIVPVEASVAVVHGAAGDASHFLAQVYDMTERKHFEGQLRYLADHDPLTAMFNRRRFEHELERELMRAQRHGTIGAVLVIDIDHFKYVNDSLGHSAGDQLIARVGGIFQARLRATDVIARLGGDEFAVILPATDRSGAMLVADNLLAALRADDQMTNTAGPRRVTASIGIAPFGDGPVSSDDLLVEADIAMYDAKEAGRDRAALYSAAEGRQVQMHSRLTWADRIRDALERDSFVLYAQPILSLQDDAVPRHELLLRMRSEAGELIPPGTFLYVAERFDLIQPIDRWVLCRAIELLAEAKHAGKELHLEVNLSAKSLTDLSLPEFVAGQLASHAIDGHGLCVEITETAAIVNLDQAKRFAHDLGELGCEFALDDFGAGFASFYYLKHMAFDFVKIDGEFIRGLPGSHVNQLVVQSVVELARGLGKRTIAEFVDGEDTLELLRRYRVDYAQGFYIAEPAAIETLDLARPRAPLTPVR